MADYTYQRTTYPEPSSDDTSQSSQHLRDPTSDSQFPGLSFFPSGSSGSSPSASPGVPYHIYAHSQPQQAHHYHRNHPYYLRPVPANSYQYTGHLQMQMPGIRTSESLTRQPPLLQPGTNTREPTPSHGSQLHRPTATATDPSSTTISRAIGEFPSITVPPASGSDTYQGLNPNKLVPSAICREFVLVENHVTTLKHQVQGLIQQTTYLKERSELTEKALTARIYELESQIRELKISNSVRRQEEDDVVEVSDDSGSDDSDSEKAVDASRAASKSNPVKALTTMMYLIFLGTSSLANKSDLPVYTDDTANLPMVRGTNVKQVRFKWDQTWKDQHNHQTIMTLVAFAYSHGKEYVVNVKESLDVIAKSDMEKRFVLKYVALQKIWRGTNQKQARVSEGGLSAAARDNRARGKLEVRIRKRALLPEDSEWRDKKYDPVFCVQLMSDDEDTKDADTGAIVGGSFTSRPPVYRSRIVNNLFENIDAIADSRVSNQYTKHIQGAVKEQGPPHTRTLAGRARRWMVDTNWLEAHPEFDNESRLADSGRLWGDSLDPEEIAEKTKQAKVDKETRKRLKANQLKKNITAKEKSKSKGKAKAKRTSLPEIPEEDQSDDMYASENY